MENAACDSAICAWTAMHIDSEQLLAVIQVLTCQFWLWHRLVAAPTALLEPLLGVSNRRFCLIHFVQPSPTCDAASTSKRSQQMSVCGPLACFLPERSKMQLLACACSSDAMFSLCP